MRDMHATTRPARDEEEMAVRADGQDWIVSWHSPTSPPAGTPHGASGVCFTDGGEVVLISRDGYGWGLPGGRPEGDERWVDTLRREVLEEACATVVEARLLGFGRSRCVRGHEAGLVLVRSMWSAKVELAPWAPTFEIPHRRVVPAAEAVDAMALSDDSGLDRILMRALQEAGVTS